MNFTNNPKIALVLDDHSLFAESFARILEDLRIFSNVQFFTKDNELKEYLLKTRTSHSVYLFLDYYIGDKVIVSFFSELRRIVKNPKIIIVSGMTNPNLIKNLLDSKINGMIHKGDNASEIIDCLEEIEKGNFYQSPSVQNILTNFDENPTEVLFSSREMEMLSLFARGLTVEEAAQETNLSFHTVSAHRRKMFQKARCNNISELLAFARKLELI